jgi:hypothetical protein
VKPRTYRRLSATVDAALVFAVAAWIGIAAAFLSSLTPPPSTSPAVSASGAFPRGGWVTAGDSSSTTEPAPENARMEIDQTFLDALAAVETNGNDAAINFAEDAHGRYQIRAAYLADANRFLGSSYTLADMHDQAKAERVVMAYLRHYGTERGVTSLYDLARIHNGGPKGAEKRSTIDYGARVWEALARIRLEARHA